MDTQQAIPSTSFGLKKLVSNEPRNDTPGIVADSSVYSPEWSSMAAPPAYERVGGGDAGVASNTGGNRNERSDLVKYSGPYKQLWTILLAESDVLGVDLVHKQLEERRDDLITAFCSYQPEDWVKTPITEEMSLKDKLISEFSNKFRMEKTTALDIFAQYILFEYKGEVTSLNQLLADDKIREQILYELEMFYTLERLCKLYCSQVIMVKATVAKHPYQELFSEYLKIPNVLEAWVEALCNSINLARNADERQQVNHTLALLLSNHYDIGNVLETFFTSYNPLPPTRISEAILQADAVLVCTFLQCGGPGQNELISTYLEKQAKDIYDNKYILGAYVAAYKTRCEGLEGQVPVLRRVLGSAPKAHNCVQDMASLLKMYDLKSVKNKHGVGDLLAQNIAHVAETILRTCNKEMFGTVRDWCELFCTLIIWPKVQETLIDRELPEEFFNLWEYFNLRFPLDLDSNLEIWNALIRGALTSDVVAKTLKKISTRSTLSESFDDIDPNLLKPGPNPEFPEQLICTEDRTITDVSIKAGSIGTLLEPNDEHPSLVISWSLPAGPDAQSSPVSIWDIVGTILSRALEPVNSQNKISSKSSCTLSLTAKLVIKICKRAEYLPPKLSNLGKFIADSLHKLAIFESDNEEKCRLLALYTKLIHGISTFDIHYLQRVSPGFWPFRNEESLIFHYILTKESVTQSNLFITRAFLRIVENLFRKSSSPKNPALKSPFDITNDQIKPQVKHLYEDAINFIRENILTGFLQWKISNFRIRHTILCDMLLIFQNLFNAADKWTSLQESCCEVLLGPASPLLHIITIDEFMLQYAVARPKENIRFLPKILHLALSLLVKLAAFNRQTLHRLFNLGGLEIVQKLSRMVRHRINGAIPTLASILMRKFAEESNLSILSCLGRELHPFRDLVIQRLVYKTEMKQLKATLFDFLSVCSQTQSGLIGHFLEDDTLIVTAFEFIEEPGNDGSLVLAACNFIRALVLTRNLLLRRYRKNIWNGLTFPVKEITRFLSPQLRKKIISTVLHTICMEIQYNGFKDPNFVKELQEIFKEDLWNTILGAALDGRDEDSIKCALAMKHCLNLLHGNPSLDQEPFKASFESTLAFVTEGFWIEKELKDSPLRLRGALAEIMLILCPSNSEAYLEGLVQKMLEHFFDDSLNVQVPILSCVHKSLVQMVTPVSPNTMECIIKIVIRILEHGYQLYTKKDETNLANALMCTAAKTMTCMIKIVDSSSWGSVFEKSLIVPCMVKLVHVGIVKTQAPDMICECLITLTGLSKCSSTAKLIRNNSLFQNFWAPVANLGLQIPDADTEKWFQVLLNCIILNKELLKTESNYYIEEALKFWSIHSVFVARKFIDFHELINRCLLHGEEGSSQQLMILLVFNCYSAESLKEMLRYLKQWTDHHHSRVVPDLINSLLLAMQAAMSLLQYPNNVLMIMSKRGSITAATESSKVTKQFNLTPDMHDLQYYLWRLIKVGISVFWEIRDNTEIFDVLPLIRLLYAVMGTGVKSMAKPVVDKKVPPPTNLSNVTTAMEVCLSLLASSFQLKLHELENLPDAEAQVAEFKRNHSMEIISMCEEIRRYFTDEFADGMCSFLENYIKVPPVQ